MRADYQAEHDQLESRLRSKTEEINRIRQQKQNLERTIESLRYTSTQITKLTNDIADMKAQKIELQRKIEQVQREHRMQLEEKKKEIQALQKQTRQQTRQISDLQRSNTKSDSLLRNQIDQTTQLQRQLREVKLSADNQRREYEIYSREDQKRLKWLERELAKESRKDLELRQLKKRLEQKDQMTTRLKDMIRQLQEEKRRSRSHITRGSGHLEADARERLEELADRIMAQQNELDIQKDGIVKMEQLAMKRSSEEAKAIATLKALEPAESTAMCVLLYRRSCDFIRGLNDTEMKVKRAILKVMRSSERPK